MYWKDVCIAIKQLLGHNCTHITWITYDPIVRDASCFGTVDCDVTAYNEGPFQVTHTGSWRLYEGDRYMMPWIKACCFKVTAGRQPICGRFSCIAHSARAVAGRICLLFTHHGLNLSSRSSSMTAELSKSGSSWGLVQATLLHVHRDALLLDLQYRWLRTTRHTGRQGQLSAGRCVVRWPSVAPLCSPVVFSSFPGT